MKSILWHNIREGDSGAMKILYQDCYQELYAYGFRMLADKELIQDVLHEIFTNIWINRKNLSEVSHVEAYLKTTLRNKLLRELSTHKNFTAIEDEPSVQALSELSYEALLIESQFIEERKAKMAIALDKLTPTQREIIKLKFYESLSYEAIAEKLNLKHRTVYNHIYAAICTLRIELAGKK